MDDEAHTTDRIAVELIRKPQDEPKPIPPSSEPGGWENIAPGSNEGSTGPMGVGVLVARNFYSANSHVECPLGWVLIDVQALTDHGTPIKLLGKLSQLVWHAGIVAPTIVRCRVGENRSRAVILGALLFGGIPWAFALERVNSSQGCSIWPEMLAALREIAP